MKKWSETMCRCSLASGTIVPAFTPERRMASGWWIIPGWLLAVVLIVTLIWRL